LGILELGRLARSDAKDDALFAQLQDGVARAIQHGLSAVSADSGDYENWVSLARLYEQLVGAQVQGAYERAREAYTAAATANPTNPAPHLFLARLALVNKDEKTAREEIARALEIKVNYAPAHFLLSQIEASNENADAALVSAERAVQSAPEEPLAWFQVGVLLYAKQDYEKSAVAFEQAVLRNNTYANALYFLALSYAQLGRTDDALAALRQVLLSNPDNTEVKALIERLSSGAPVTTQGTPEETTDETL
jgi:tetratricopeptide (TPR) repeat protein